MLDKNVRNPVFLGTIYLMESVVSKSNIGELGNLSAQESLEPATVESLRYRYRWAIYGGLNLLIFLFVAVASVFSTQDQHNPFIYLVLLFALCSAPAVLIKETNGPYSLLLVSGPILFLFYGFNDLAAYFIYLPNHWHAENNVIITTAELTILVGFIFLFWGYISGVKFFPLKKNHFLTSDWSTGWTVIIGLCCILLGLMGTWGFQLSSHDGSVSSKVSPLVVTIQVLARMLEPVGVVLLSYAYLKTRSFSLFIIVVSIAAIKLPLGIILNSKEIGISFIAIFIMTKWIYDGKLPYSWIVTLIIIVTLYFPFSYAYRATIGDRQMSVAKSIEKADVYLGKAAKQNKKNGGIASGVQSVAGRLDLKSLMELIVSRTGKDVRYQNGYTLIELPLVFIPRMIWPGKPAVAAGQLFNQEFKISANPKTYISTSFFGEMYWNFGWLGVSLGMFAIGCFWGGIGKFTNIFEHKNVTRMLLLISAIYLLILRFEAGIAQQFILFLRSGLIVLILHLIFRNRL